MIWFSRLGNCRKTSVNIIFCELCIFMANVIFSIFARAAIFSLPFQFILSWSLSASQVFSLFINKNDKKIFSLPFRLNVFVFNSWISKLRGFLVYFLFFYLLAFFLFLFSHYFCCYCCTNFIFNKNHLLKNKCYICRLCMLVSCCLFMYV